LVVIQSTITGGWRHSPNQVHAIAIGVKMSCHGLSSGQHLVARESAILHFPLVVASRKGGQRSSFA